MSEWDKPPPEWLEGKVLPRGPELEYNKDPLFIGTNCVGDAVELPAGVRDRGVAEFGESGSVEVYGSDRWKQSIERLEKVYTDDEIKDVMSKAAAELEKKFLLLLDEMVVPNMPYPWEYIIRAQGLDPDDYVAIDSEWRDGVMHVSLAQKAPPEYIIIDLTMVGDKDAGQDEADGQDGRKVQG